MSYKSYNISPKYKFYHFKIDGSDESSCSVHDRCQPNEFKCNNGKCVLKTWRCGKYLAIDMKCRKNHCFNFSYLVLFFHQMVKTIVKIIPTKLAVQQHHRVHIVRAVNISVKMVNVFQNHLNVTHIMIVSVRTFFETDFSTENFHKNSNSYHKMQTDQTKLVAQNRRYHSHHHHSFTYSRVKRLILRANLLEFLHRWCCGV